LSNKELAVVLVSGGMDSCLSAAIAAENYELAFLHLNYGQKTEIKELESFNKIADFYSVQKRLVADVQHFSKIGGSSLTDNQMEISDADIHNKNVPTSYVPFRNANILSIAVSWAEVINAKKIFIGAVEEDSSGYPDCTETFFEAFNNVIKIGTKPETKIEIVTPIIHLSKSGIVKKSIELEAPLHLTWSCYKNNDIACGVCDSCALRLKGFQLVSKVDPIQYSKRPSYL
jgi:7-cyano-7-deazaguanine synthase